MTDAIDHRYETKFVLGRRQVPEFLSWMHSLPKFHVLYPARYVNSLYFDNYALDSVRDNIIGLPRRRKFRLRWYHEDEVADGYGLRFEIKCRNNRVGYKQLHDAPISVQELLDLDLQSVGDVFGKSVPHSARVPAQVFRNPMVHIVYCREYFEIDKGIRVTLDTEVQFFCLQACSGLYQRRPTSYPRNIVEIKYEMEDRERVSRILKTANMTPARHSKYLAGLAALNHTVYI